MCLGEFSYQLAFCLGGVNLNGRFPANGEIVAVLELPNESATPVSDGFAGTKAHIGPESLLEQSTGVPSASLTDIENDGAVDPQQMKSLNRDRGVLTLESTPTALRGEDAPIRGGTDDQIHTRLLWHTLTATRVKIADAAEADKSRGLKCCKGTEIHLRHGASPVMRASASGKRFTRVVANSSGNASCNAE